MRRAYLDTNILVFLGAKIKGGLSDEIRELLSDYTISLLTSTECVKELIYNLQIGRIPQNKKDKNALTPYNVFEWLESMNIKVVPVDKQHLKKFAELPLYDDHKYPGDRIIIAQAIADKVSLVSSDRKFNRYKKNGLEFLYNER
jgi:PIN domain nuclease of toxin-antitoxin system